MTGATAGSRRASSCEAWPGPARFTRWDEPMNLLLGALAEGFLFTALALGLYLSWRIYAILDLTVDGAFALGAAACAALLMRNVNPLVATAVGGLAGSGAGIITGLLCTRR